MAETLTLDLRGKGEEQVVRRGPPAMRRLCLKTTTRLPLDKSGTERDGVGQRGGPGPARQAVQSSPGYEPAPPPRRAEGEKKGTIGDGQTETRPSEEGAGPEEAS